MVPEWLLVKIIEVAREQYVDAETDDFYVELTSKRARVDWIRGVVDTLWYDLVDEDDLDDMRQLRALQRRAVEELLPEVTARSARSDVLWKAGLIR